MRELEELLKDCGIKVVTTTNKTSCGNNGNNATLLLSQPQRSPKLSFNKKNQNLVLYYPGGFDFGQQQFVFEIDDFLDAFQNAKFKKYISKFQYLDFDKIFFDKYYPNANQRVKLIFKYFSITPSLVNKVVHQNKKNNRKARIGFKTAEILRGLNLYEKKGNGGNRGKRERLKGINDVEIRSNIANADDIEQKQQKNNMDIAVRNAAKFFDFNFFEQYKIAYLSLNSLKFLPHRKELALFDYFKKQVLILQKKL